MDEMKHETAQESLYTGRIETPEKNEETVGTDTAPEIWDTHVETAEEVRQRVRSASTANAIIIQPKPKPTIHDTLDKNVAVYGRVSTNSREQVSSIENQYKYYDEKIRQTPNWHKQKIYMDEGKSGTSMHHREAFKEMLADAQNGMILPSLKIRAVIRSANGGSFVLSLPFQWKPEAAAKEESS